MDETYWARLLASEYTGRKFLIVSDVLAGATGLVRFLGECGAHRPFILSASEGMGPLPDPADAEWVLLGTHGSTTMGYIRAFLEAVSDLPAAVEAQIDAWDPDRTAEVLDGFLVAESQVAGRPHYGTRPRAWLDLEDKTTIDGVWDRAEVRRAPSVVVPVAGAEIEGLAGSMDWGAGTVWVGDNADGWHGGAEYLRWVRSAGDAVGAQNWFATKCGQVRIMPFLEGIPCSVHGFVFPDFVAAIRPIEMLVLRKAGTTELKYVGTASFWDPPASYRDEMRDVARRVGDVLRADYGYAGGFTVDGVMTRDGFLPTELNPRMGVGVIRAVRGLRDLALPAINRALIAGVDIDYRPREFEHTLVAESDAKRSGIGFMMVDAAPDEKEERGAMLSGGQSRLARPGETAEATVAWDRGSPGGFVAVRPDPGHVPPGIAIASWVQRGFEVADRVWDLGLPEFTAAEDLHAEP
jgi:hypothetical protein